MSRHIAETAEKENEYAKHQLAMAEYKRKMRIYHWLLEVGNLVLWLFSAAYSYLWFSLHKFGFAIAVKFLDEEIGTVNFPVFVITAVLGPVMLVLCFCADVFRKKKLLICSCCLSVLLFVLLLVNFITGYEPVKLHNFIAFELIMFIETAASLYFMGVFRIDEELRTKPGYPDFNFSVSEVLTPEQKKYMDWYNARQKGVYTSSNKVQPPVIESADIGAEALLPDDDYKVEDIRRKPL